MNIANESELMEKLHALGATDPKDQARITCSLIGHSNIQTEFWGYYCCARCGEQIGDSIGGTYDASEVVVVGHDCPLCRKNYKSMDWRDKIFVSDPFQLEDN